MKTERKSEIIGMLCSCCDKCSVESYYEDLRNAGEKFKSDESYINLSNFGTAISSTERIILLNALKNKDRCVCELEVILHKSQSTVSHHLRKLESANLVSGYKKGNYTYYHLEKKSLESYYKSLQAIFR